MVGSYVQAQMPNPGTDFYADVDKDYYLFPIAPGKISTLAGTMGELRTTHFHMGLDIRTNGTIGLPVLAAADGYISRVAVRTSGYGYALYVTHPNGTTTVYAHLNGFAGAIALHVRNHQYIKKSFNTNLYLKKGQFKVSKGDTIAFSGNSGSSGGPHLHFEIRDKNQNVLNPLKYNFSEIEDTRAPVIKSVSFTTLGDGARINGQIGRFQYNQLLYSKNKGYYLKDSIYASGSIGMETYAFDLINHANFKCGITKIELEINNKTIFNQQIDKLSFSNQRSIYAHYNYWNYKSSGEKHNKLYIDNGNFLKIFNADNKGKIQIEEGKKYHLKATFTDSYGNYTTFTCNIKGDKDKLVKTETQLQESSLYAFHQDLLVLKSNKVKAQELPQAFDSLYTLNGNTYYATHMDEPLVRSINEQFHTELQFKNKVPASRKYTYFEDRLKVTFPAYAVFEDHFLQTQLNNSEAIESFVIGDPSRFALRKSIAVQYTPKGQYKQQKAAVYSNNYNRLSYVGGSWNNGQISFKTRTFGTFVIKEDTIPPSIRVVRVDKNRLTFKISDDLSGIKSFKMKVNGKWVLMNYDYKTTIINSEKLNNAQPFSGPVVLEVVDNMNNKKLYQTKL